MTQFESALKEMIKLTEVKYNDMMAEAHAKYEEALQTYHVIKQIKELEDKAVEEFEGLSGGEKALVEMMFMGMLEEVKAQLGGKE
jgi:hypothetical protein